MKRLVVGCVYCFCAAGCSAVPDSVLVIGLSGTVPEATRAKLSIKIGDEPAIEKELRRPEGPLFPSELEVKSGHPTDVVSVRLELFADGILPSGPAILTRTCTVPFVPHEERLLRLRVDSRCITALPNVAWGPVCGAPHQTCIDGRCSDDSLIAADLLPYSDRWYDDPADTCLGVGSAEPAIHIGTGQTAYEGLTPNELMSVERGPQGGHHLYVGFRLAGMSQSHSTITIRGLQPDTLLAIPPTAFLLSLDPQTDGWCQTAGLRYQLDNGGTDYTQFLGKPLRLSVDAQDTAGRHAADSVVVQVASVVTGQ